MDTRGNWYRSIKKKKTFLEMLIDSTQDVSVTDQLAVCVRYEVQTDVKERFITFLPLKS